MRRPSIKTLTDAFPLLSLKDAQRIRNAMEDRHPRQAMEIIDAYLGTYGVEYIPQGRGTKSPAVTYCNTGDPYRVTVLYVNSNYRVGCWGDIVERGSYDSRNSASIRVV